MKRRDLLKRLAEVAAEADEDLELVRSRGGHDIYRIGTTMLPIPRHNEINEHTAKAIIKDAQEGS